VASVIRLGASPGHTFGESGAAPTGWDPYYINAVYPVKNPWAEVGKKLRGTMPDTYREGIGPKIKHRPSYLRLDVAPDPLMIEAGILWDKANWDVHTEIFFAVLLGGLNGGTPTLSIIEGNAASWASRASKQLPGDWVGEVLTIEAVIEGRTVTARASTAAGLASGEITYTHTKDFIDGVYGIWAQGNANAVIDVTKLHTGKAGAGLCQMI
jgi:hypothetical protein